MINALELLFGRRLLDGLVSSLAAALSKAKEKGRDCSIPTTECPPRCVGKIHWTFGRGATPRASIVVRNTGKVSRDFSFSATPLAGSAVGAAHLIVEPPTALLHVGESKVVHVRLADSAALQPCQEYHAEFLFTGAWERCVKLEMSVRRDAVEVCRLEQRPDQKLLHLERTKASIDWKIDRGVVPEAQVALRNAGNAAQNFRIEATPWLGPDGAAASLAISTHTIDLGPAESTMIDLRMLNTQALRPGQEYQCELVVRGFHEQRLAVRCMVHQDPNGYVEVSQGELPTRIRAHHWYDHFQCTEPCVTGSSNPKT